MLQPVSYGIPSVAPESAHVFKTSQGYLFSLNVTTGAVAGWLMLIDSASVPLGGGAAVTPVWWWQIGINTTVNLTWDSFPLIFANGIVAIFSSTGPFTYTESQTAVFSGQVA